jgi:2-polyprenyl-3-methyl-5-hydroxy-6-metoxy-1,4-benzoquinol methylase
VKAPNGPVKLAGSAVRNDEELGALYRARICEYGFSPEALFYQSDVQHQHKLSAVSDAIRSIANLSRKALLDIGCGYGALLEHALDCRYVGIDIVPEFVEEATRRYPAHEFRVSSASAFESESFDVCVLAGVLSGVPAPRDLLTQTFRIAREVVVFDVTLADRIPREYEDLNRWSLAEVESVAHEAGYALASKTDCGHSWLVFGAVRVAR